MASEAMMFSPLPRKALQSFSQSPILGSDNEDALGQGRTFWYQVDESTLSIGNLASNADDKLVPNWTPAFLYRTLSDASTSAGPSPAPDMDGSLSPIHCGSEPCSPDYYGTPSRRFSEDSVMSQRRFSEDLCEDSAQPLQSEATGGVPAKQPSMLQVRKVFVGGIPQSVDQDDLFKLFSSVAKVKKAWLQMFHSERHVTNARKHRGFGFVIFSDKQAVDTLLGEDYSRFISFGHGLQLEVKRALGKLAAVALTPDQQGPKDDLKASKRITGTPGSTAMQTVSALQTPLPKESDGSSRIDAYTSLPLVPPFPTWGTPEAKGLGAPATTFNGPWPQFVPQRPMMMHCVMYPALPNMNPLANQPLPENQQDLTLMLLQAMPDHYDD